MSIDKQTFINTFNHIVDSGHNDIRIGDFYDRLQAAQSQQLSWVSVKDRLPEENKIVLAYHSTNNNCATNYLRDEVWQERVNNINNDVTHWMPLPEPPNESTPTEYVERSEIKTQSASIEITEYEKLRKQFMDLQAEIQRVKELLKKCKPYIDDLQAENTNEPSVGLFCDYELQNLATILQNQ